MARSGFTLIELTLVIAIILLVSVLTLPMVIGGIQHRQVSEAARTLQGTLAGARDQAIRDNAPSGIRLVPDATQPGCYASLVPLSTPPSYSIGLVSVNPDIIWGPPVLLGTKALVLEEASQLSIGLPAEPTSWAWNVRVGDKIQINSAGSWYTVCGPMIQANDEGFINYGAGSAVSILRKDWLLLTNGIDDDGDGWIDSGWDGVDNNHDGQTDDPLEWEQEAWLGSLANGVSLASYTIRRRPAPVHGQRSTALPSNIVVDGARSNLPSLDIIVNPNGSLSPVSLYGVPSSVVMGGSFAQFWLSERSDVGIVPTGHWWLVSANMQSGRVSETELPDLMTGLSQARQE